MEWISVEDRLPAVFDYVLFVENGLICAGQYVDDHWTDYLRPDAYGDPEDCVNVTHWMPLPDRRAESAGGAGRVDGGEMNQEAKLCYVNNQWAYFTTQPLSEQWGDDWNDAPYEHNAGAPYEYGEHDRKRGKQPWKIIKVAFDGPLSTPADMAHFGSSAYSVEHINAVAVAWLTTQYSKEKVNIFAGVTVEEFTQLVQKAGGNVYLPVPSAVLMEAK